LKDAGEWWDIVWNSGIESALSPLPPEQAQRFKAEHLAEVSTLATPNGIWLNVPTIFATGRKPSAKT
jgi:hypothetical protein